VSKKRQTEIVLVDQIEPCILLIRGQRVMLDADLAALYGTTTKAFNQAVKRNLDRFPADFMFRLTAEEAAQMRSQTVTTSVSSRSMRSQDATADLRSQIVTSSSASHGGRRYLPYAFTEHGVLMAASVLNTPRAMEVSVYVIRAFVRLREMLSTHKELAGKLAELERKVAGHDSAIPALTQGLGRVHAEAVAVCLESQKHQDPVRLVVRRIVWPQYALSWPALTDTMRRAYEDLERATELGAYGVAILLVRDRTGLTAIRQSRKGTGFDYWLGPDRTDDQLVFQNAARLEVSGILSGTDSQFLTRMKQKLKQTQASDSSGLPAYACVVEFGRPQAEVAIR